MGSTPFGKANSILIALVTPENIKVAPGIVGCAMASDRL